MSPEIIKGKLYNDKTDMWSLGCVIYELASFHKPFAGDGIFQVLESVKDDPAPSIKSIYSDKLNTILKM